MIDRNEARDCWRKSGLRAEDISAGDLRELRKHLDAEMAAHGGKIGMRTTKCVRTKGGNSIEVRCAGYHFEDREAVTFYCGAFADDCRIHPVGFSGWADDVNVQPILRGFMSWLKKKSFGAIVSGGGSVMRVLSIRYPWSQAIVEGLKDVENRDWKTPYRGPLAIHQSKVADQSDCFAFDEVARRAGVDDVTVERITKREGGWPGAIVGVVDLVDCVTASTSPWFFGHAGFVLANPRRLLRPIHCRGQLGVRPLPADVAAEIAAQLGEAAP